MKLRPSRTRKRGRIEIIPMIDVMFFLLVTFMLASLSMTHLNALAVNLPKGDTAALPVKRPLTVTVTASGDLLVNDVPVTLDTIAAALKPLLADPQQPIVIAADQQAPHGTVIEAMLRAQSAGAEHFVFAIKHG